MKQGMRGYETKLEAGTTTTEFPSRSTPRTREPTVVFATKTVTKIVKIPAKNAKCEDKSHGLRQGLTRLENPSSSSQILRDSSCFLLPVHYAVLSESVYENASLMSWTAKRASWTRTHEFIWNLRESSTCYLWLERLLNCKDLSLRSWRFWGRFGQVSLQIFLGSHMLTIKSSAYICVSF